MTTYFCDLQQKSYTFAQIFINLYNNIHYGYF